MSALTHLRQKVSRRAGRCYSATPATHEPKSSDSSSVASEYRRRRALRLLHSSPGRKYAYVADASDPAGVALVIAVRDVGTSELIIPHEKYDPFALIDALSSDGALLELSRDATPTGPDEIPPPAAGRSMTAAGPGQATGQCPHCGGGDFWNLGGERKCARCHPDPKVKS